MIRSELKSEFATRDLWRRRRRRDLLLSAAGWVLTGLCICWLLLIAVAGLYPPA
ncbi:MAG TPA: hypothetical protein VET65_13385 [Candidatus Limnocylindrales bacterium]|nr:hypothetical protein [Candidatus Limnocylindrales bacterium]